MPRDTSQTQIYLILYKKFHTNFIFGWFYYTARKLRRSVLLFGPVCGFVCGCVCGWDCYHDNSKLRASILSKLGL